MPVRFNEENEKRIERLIERYPDRRAAIIPALQILQEQQGFVADEGISYIAERLSVPPAKVYGILTFYTMLRRRPAGKYHLQVCTNLSCTLCGAEKNLEKLDELVGVGHGEKTEDGLFSVEHVECLGSCGTSPVIQVNDDYHEGMTPEKLEELINSLRAKEQE